MAILNCFLPICLALTLLFPNILPSFHTSMTLFSYFPLYSQLPLTQPLNPSALVVLSLLSIMVCVYAGKVTGSQV